MKKPFILLILIFILFSSSLYSQDYFDYYLDTPKGISNYYITNYGSWVVENDILWSKIIHDFIRLNPNSTNLLNLQSGFYKLPVIPKEVVEGFDPIKIENDSLKVVVKKLKNNIEIYKKQIVIYENLILKYKEFEDKYLTK
jgi:hypothetical protein